MNTNCTDSDDLRSVYEALSGLHDTIVGSRFAVAGLYMAALAFLVSTLPENETAALVPTSGIATLGLVLTLALWVLEIRNVCLLENLDEQGRSIEATFRIKEDLGLFRLTHDQPKGPKLPLLRCRLPYRGKAKQISSWLFSHSTGLSLVYLLGGCFWCWVLWRAR